MSTLSLNDTAPKPLELDAKIRVGIVGVGNWARNGPLPALTLLSHYEIVAIYSQRIEAARAAAAEYDIRHVAVTLDELATHAEVDLILVLTTGPQHELAVRAAIDAGKDVYCEWPLTPRAETSADLVELARVNGVRTILGTQRRLAPAFRYAKDLIADGYVGRVRSVRMGVSVIAFGQPRDQALRWSAIPENFMDVTSIFGAHMMDPLFSVVGRPVEIAAVSVNQWPEVTILETGETIPTTAPDQLMLSGFLASGAVFSVHIEGGKHHGQGVEVVITGDDGDLIITNASAFGNDPYQVAGAKRDGTAVTALPVPAAYNWLPPSTLPMFAQESADLFEAYARDVANGTQIVPTFADALFMQRLLNQAGSSSATGQRLTVAA